MSTDALRIADLSFRYQATRLDSEAASARAASGATGIEPAPWRLRVSSLSLAPGEQMLLTGGSGSGKSTLLHLVAGLIDPDAGRVEVGGQAVHELRAGKRDEFRGRSMGMIFQTFNLLAGFSAVENVLAALMFSSRPAREHRAHAEALLRGLGIDRPDAPVERLSVGQQQRVAVARAVACGPALVLGDEPTASLDPKNADESMELIQSTCRTHGAALLCVSHDPSMAKRFARTIDMRELLSVE
jgi:ABC-type lipoprotein export system ATPase subunit